MVVRNSDGDTVDGMFRALANSTRRDILGRCLAEESSVSGLAEAYPMSFAAVQKHVAVLDRAGLVTKHRRGREQVVRAEPDAICRAREALDHLETVWRGRVDRMTELLANETETPSNERAKGHDQ